MPRYQSQYKLFNFVYPVDRHQISVLARRIYPTNRHSFMNVYRNATEKSYGHLVIFHIFEQKVSVAEHRYIRDTPSHYQRIYSVTKTIRDTPVKYIESDSIFESDNSLDMQVSDDCGIVFCDFYSLHNHVKRWCKQDRAETPPLTRWISYDQSEEDVEDIDSDEHKVFGVMYR